MVDELPPLIDTHCHLAWKAFEPDLDAVLARMAEEGVAQAIVVATDPATALASRELARGRPHLHPTVGLHPNDLGEDWEDAFAAVERLAASGDFRAVGETGLDEFRKDVPPERQRASFARHAELARRLDLPLIVHIRDQDGRFAAYDGVAEILGATPGVRGVIHCYTGDAAHAERYRAFGFLISFSGIVTFPKGENVRRVAAVTPLESALVETDAPFLAPEPFRGKRNEPGYVARTARELARVMGRQETEVRARTTENARALFRI